MSQKIAIAVAATVLAALTWHFIEQPFRRRGAGGFTRPVILWSGGISLGALAGVALLFVALQGIPARFAPQVLETAAAEHDSSPWRTKCHFNGTAAGKYENSCVFGEPVPPKIIVYGDSHGAELSVALGALAKTHHESVRQITASGCPPAAGFSYPRRGGCANYNEAMLAKLVSIPPATIVIAANSSAWSEEASERYWQGLRTSLAALSAAGHRLIVLSQIPHLPNQMPAPASVARWTVQGNHPADFAFAPDERLGEVNANLQKIASEVNATYVPVAPALCKGEKCHVYLDDAVLYFDDNHLSMHGARIVAERLLVPLLWPEGEPVMAGAGLSH